MSQDASTNPGLLHPSDRPPTEAEQQRLRSEADFGSEPLGFAVESYADDLMDDLFEEVERFLNGGNPSLPNPALDPDPIQDRHPPLEEPAIAPPLPSPPVASPSSQLVLPSMIQPLPEGEPELRESVVESSPEPASAPVASPRPMGRSYDRLLLGLGCISILVTLAIWLISQRTQQQATVVTTAVPQPSPVNPTTVNDREFAEYMQRSLQTIDQRSTAPGSTILSPTALQPGTTLPPVSVPGTPAISPHTTATLTGRIPTGLERVYVPVYQLPPNLLQPGSSIAPLPGGSSAIRLPSSPTAPANKPSTAPTPSTVTAAVPRTLVGVMDLGNDSAALVEINGVTQRYRVGESISSSGWTLVEISKNQAIIRRNGEVRSVFIGQSF
ncbi:type II secretion system protein N [Pantanalinema rosaneae CENA516]|uniref:type II secretion system protein N n=1 Tax=Pantanalinema rosaneae TaxID=1620701 RepID=UPI003D6F4F8B